MTDAAGAAPSRAKRRRVPLWLDILVTTAFVLLFARLVYLPQARPLGSGDAVTAPAGQWLVLDGLTAGTVLNLTTDVPGEVKLAAPSAALDPDSRAYLQGAGLAVPQAAAPGPAAWTAGAAGKATLVADLTVSAPDTRLALSVIPGAKGVALRIDRGSLTASLRLDSQGPARGFINLPGAGPQVLGPGRPVGFVLTPGGSPSPALGFAIAGPVHFALLQDDGSDNPVALTGLEVDADRAAQTRTCGGANGSIVFWPALFQPRARPIPALSLCRPGRMTLGELALQPDAVVARPAGSAYVPGELPVWNTLKTNPAVAALLLAIIGYPATRLLGELRGLFKSPAAKPGEAP